MLQQFQMQTIHLWGWELQRQLPSPQRQIRRKAGHKTTQGTPLERILTGSRRNGSIGCVYSPQILGMMSEPHSRCVEHFVVTYTPATDNHYLANLNRLQLRLTPAPWIWLSLAETAIHTVPFLKSSKNSCSPTFPRQVTMSAKENGGREVGGGIGRGLRGRTQLAYNQDSIK